MMERLTEWKDDKKMLAKPKFRGDFGSQNILQSLAEYEDLEELIGIPLKNLAEICNNKISEECRNPKKAIVLTDKDADRWSEYKSAEEQGLLLRLPCGIGADIYFVPSKSNFKLNILQGYPQSNRVYHQTVERITFTENGWYLECGADLEFATGHIMVDESYKETWFLTRAEAEQKLKEMESD